MNSDLDFDPSAVPVNPAANVIKGERRLGLGPAIQTVRPSDGVVDRELATASVESGRRSRGGREQSLSRQRLGKESPARLHPGAPTLGRSDRGGCAQPFADGKRLLDSANHGEVRLGRSEHHRMPAP